MTVVLVVVGVVLVLAGLLVILRRVRRSTLHSGLAAESPQTRRAVRRAIRTGGTDDPYVDRLARDVIRVTPRLRWGRYFFAAMLVLSIVLLALGPYDPWRVVQRLAQAALWLGLIVLNVVNQRRLDGYRGLPD